MTSLFNKWKIVTFGKIAVRTDYCYDRTSHCVLFLTYNRCFYIFILCFINFLTTLCNLIIYATWDNKGRHLKHNINKLVFFLLIPNNVFAISCIYIVVYTMWVYVPICFFILLNCIWSAEEEKTCICVRL